MKLAWQNLSYDRSRFAVTIVGIAFAVFLMIFQGSLLLGFLRAASKVVDSVEADLWITARGVPCFDFAAPLPDRFRELALGVPGVISVERVASGFASWQKPSGARQIVVLVGMEPEVGVRSAFQDLRHETELAPEAVFLDRSNRDTLEVTAVPAELEISRRRARVAGMVEGFSSFLGSPYVFTRYRDAVRYIGLGQEETVFLVARVAAGRGLDRVRDRLRLRLPEANVWTRVEFSRRCRVYWLVQTGAGGSILTAALLGFLVGLVIVSQNIYATTMDNIEEFATLKAIGAPRRYIQSVVLTQAIVSGLFGSGVGLLGTYPLVAALRTSIPWVYTPWWLPLGMVLVSLLMCGLASVASVRKAVAVEPARVFRA